MLGLALGLGWSPKLGLDLQGGLSVTYKPVPTPGQKLTASTLQTVANIMTARVGAFGVSQPNITVQGGDIVVQLPGVKDANTILQEIGNTAQLYFRPVLCGVPAYAPSKKVSKTDYYPSTALCTGGYQYSSAYYSSSGDYSPPTQYIEDPAYAAYPTAPPSADNPHKDVILSAGAGGSTGAYRYLLGPAIIDGKVADGTMIKSSSAQITSSGQWVVAFNLTSSGSTLFNDIAAANLDKLVANDLDGQVVSAPVIETSSFPGSGQISGSFTEASAGLLATDLNYGSLPVPLKQLTEQTVSPSLGKSSLRAGLFAGLLGLLLVMLYTIFYYRALGIVVVTGLITTAAFLYGFISFLGFTSFGLTLDLSGVTGLIVSVGITVDSYIVYFERLKDEVRAGRSIRSAVDRGFKSAYRTILSADAVSFIGALVLWVLSIGEVRGFAFMLGLSTLVDVATAYIFTRPLVILLGRNTTFTNAKRLGVARGLATRTVASEQVVS
jgi:preprotein translocase subunit SecD